MTTQRADLAQALDEFAEAGYEVVYRTESSETTVRIRNDVEHWEGVGPSGDQAFERALEAYGGR